MDKTAQTDLGILIIRLSFGGFMLFAHGMPKLLNFGDKVDTFPDPLGLGSGFGLVLAIFAELICSAMVIAGYRIRLFVWPLIITMLTAAFIVHAGDPWPKQEYPLLFACAYLALFFTGQGRYSVWQQRRKMYFKTKK